MSPQLTGPHTIGKDEEAEKTKRGLHIKPSIRMLDLLDVRLKLVSLAVLPGWTEQISLSPPAC